MFARLLPFATKYNLRFVFINRRDYPGSTPLTDEEVADHTSLDDARRTEFYRRQSFEIAEFLAWFVRTEDIPRYTTSANGNAEGGLALVGWSFGSTYCMDLLAYPERLPEDTRAALEPYLRNVCALEAPHHIWGLDAPSSRTFYHPLMDEGLTRIEKYGTFAVWMSSYYPHKDAYSGDPALLADFEDALEDPPPSLAVMSPEDQMAVSHPKPTLRWEMNRISVPYGQWARTENLVDRSTKEVWPRCRFTVMWGEMSIWEAVYGMWKVRELVEKKKTDGTAGREVQIVGVPGANHFVGTVLWWRFPTLTLDGQAVWDTPEQIVEKLAACL
ncbi:hypothetical protein OF83DRAFT_1146988 [Amylostereum chailletii]|nr:hypothetical protein OF83DRAFT_1146988 [Amylostereum chailletii]